MPTTTWVALLRAINLGSRRRVAMADLRRVLEALGFHDVRTHLQSGNAIFPAPGRPASIEHEIAASVEAELGLDVVQVLVRSAGELAAVVDANPFTVAKVDPAQLHAVFLSTAPSAAKRAGIDPTGFAPDRYEFGKRVIYLRLPNGVMGSKLPDWEARLGVSATMRSWKTVTRLREMACE